MDYDDFDEYDDNDDMDYNESGDFEHNDSFEENDTFKNSESDADENIDFPLSNYPDMNEYELALFLGMSEEIAEEARNRAKQEYQIEKERRREESGFNGSAYKEEKNSATPLADSYGKTNDSMHHEKNQQKSTNKNDSKIDKSECFIATAAYGSSANIKVIIFRSFKNQILSKSRLGMYFIRVYYLYSPMIAKLIHKHKLLSLITRCILDPIAMILKVLLR